MKKIRKIMFSSLPTISKLAYTYSVISISKVVPYYIPMYLFIFCDLCHFRLTTNYTLPSAKFGMARHFWTVPDNFLYHLHLLLESSSGIICSITSCSITSCAIEGVFGFYVYQFASTMHAMTFKLMNPLPTEKFSDLLRTCVAKHQKH